MTTLSAVEKKSDELYRKTLKSMTSYESVIVELKKILMDKYPTLKDAYNQFETVKALVSRYNEDKKIV